MKRDKFPRFVESENKKDEGGRRYPTCGYDIETACRGRV